MSTFATVRSEEVGDFGSGEDDFDGGGDGDGFDDDGGGGFDGGDDDF